MTTFAERTTSVKNSNEWKKSKEIRFTLLNLPSTNVFTNDPSDSGVDFFGIFILLQNL